MIGNFTNVASWLVFLQPHRPKMCIKTSLFVGKKKNKFIAVS